LFLRLIRAFHSILALILRKRFISTSSVFKLMRIGVRQNFKWTLKPGVPLMVVRVEYLDNGTTVVRCGDGRKIPVDFIEATKLAWKYPITAGLVHKNGFILDLAIPPRIVEKWGVVDCIKDIITIPPKEYPFADATKPGNPAQGQVQSSAYTVRRVEGNWGIV
jgi:hypothetical protein